MKGARPYWLLAMVLAPAASPAATPIFAPVQVDAPVHDPARHTYWYGPFCECASVLDVDGDGDLDILCNHLPWYPDRDNSNPPPNGAIAVGMKLNVRDMDADGDQDIVVAGKGGLYVFYNLGFPPSLDEKLRLTPEADYPSWISWNK